MAYQYICNPETQDLCNIWLKDYLNMLSVFALKSPQSLFNALFCTAAFATHLSSDNCPDTGALESKPASGSGLGQGLPSQQELATKLEPVMGPRFGLGIMPEWDSSAELVGCCQSELSSGHSAAFVSESVTRSLVFALRRLINFCSCSLLVNKMLRQPISSATEATSAETVLQRCRTACSQNSSDPHNWRAEVKSWFCCIFKISKISN